MTARSVASKLGHDFSDESLLIIALTHRSFGTPNNERLEFLGDGILDFVIAAALYRRFPVLPEGDLSRLRANMVRQESLHRLAQDIGIGGVLRLGEGELRSGGAQRPSILADALEALFGAVYLDAGFDAAQRVIEKLYSSLLDELKPGSSRKMPRPAFRNGCRDERNPCHATNYWEPPARHTTNASKLPAKSIILPCVQ